MGLRMMRCSVYVFCGRRLLRGQGGVCREDQDGEGRIGPIFSLGGWYRVQVREEVGPIGNYPDVDGWKYLFVKVLGSIGRYWKILAGALMNGLKNPSFEWHSK